jgi:hypothetical protein
LPYQLESHRQALPGFVEVDQQRHARHATRGSSARPHGLFRKFSRNVEGARFRAEGQG